MNELNLLQIHLVKEEGVRLEPYKDHLGWWTIGVGHLIDTRKGGKLPHFIDSFPCTEEDAYDLLLADSIAVRDQLVKRIPFYHYLSKVRKVVLLSMAFQMGVHGLMKFRKFLSNLEQGLFILAANEMLDSKWAKQDTPERAMRLAQAMKTDEEDSLV